MKTKINLQFFLVLFICFVPFFSQAQSDESALNGTWSIDVDQTISLLDAGRRSSYDALSSEEQSQQRAQYQSQQFGFLDNNVFQINMGDNTQYAEWQRESDKVQLTFSGGATVTHTIIAINDEGLVLKVAEASSSALFNQLFLVRISE